MHNDHRVKRVLKRYRKDDAFVDASLDVTDLELVDLLKACRADDDSALSVPRELDGFALARLADLMGTEFDPTQFDYFLHSYVRTEFVSSYYNDPSIISKPAPEGGPPARIPLPMGTQWVSVRPKDGREHYEAFEIEKPNDKVSV